MQQVSGQQDFKPLLFCSDQAPCPDPVEEKIRSFASLQDGWNYGEGRAPSQFVIDRVIEIYKFGKELALDAEVFPVPNGDIEISLYMRDHFMDILAHEGGGLDFSYEIGVGERYNRVDYIEDININEIEQRLNRLPKLCGASESLEITTIELNGDLRLVVSPTMTMRFQLLIENVLQFDIVLQFANTLMPSIVLVA